MTMEVRSIRFVTYVVLLLSLTACASIPTSKPVAPTVVLKSVKPLKLGFTKQELAFELELSNPNAFDLPIQTLSFIAQLGDKKVADGTSYEPVTVPANGKAFLEIIVSARIQRILGQMLSLNLDNGRDLKYDVKGFVKLANWPLKIPFKTDGNVTTKPGQ